MGGGNAQGRARLQAALLATCELRVSEPGRVPFALLGRDPGEDPVEMRVLDDDAGRELRVILRVEAGGQPVALAWSVTVPS